MAEPNEYPKPEETFYKINGSLMTLHKLIEKQTEQIKRLADLTEKALELATENAWKPNSNLGKIALALNKENEK